jgi:alkanesulfonate monooxygenase SsuD/methylene tetrahydromethanopterin reductase-like flavin-dependent oxidoreductase (luciferase family)
MSDYGHDLRFGLFATPSVDNAAEVIDLTTRADRAGLDMVTFQDHPYQPSMLDTPTLMAYLAGITERVTLGSNVLNLPLRQPAVLARAAASMDILSGGRFELGLGAGSFWDAIAAIGGPRRSPGQALRALGEAIDVIRQVWDTDTRGGVKVDGEFYRITGAKRGPATPHPIGIWLGALGPRMLALTGRAADGWLPSYEYLADGTDTIDEMNQRIDAGTTEAGRDPHAVRRHLNVMSAALGETNRGMLQGPAAQWVDQLTDLAVNHGISGVLIGGDDPHTAEVLAGEIAPAVREAVAAERS